jgi:DNA polymerase III epsilon subunit-like protein
MQTGMENDTAQDLLGCWFAKLQTLGAFKIVPLAHNWTFDASFINKFLGAGYDHLFTDFCRDTMSACLFENDFAYTNSSRIPFPKVNLPYIASQLVIEHGRAHTALGDCLTTLEVYKELIKGRLPSGANSLLGAL